MEVHKQILQELEEEYNAAPRGVYQPQYIKSQMEENMASEFSIENRKVQITLGKGQQHLARKELYSRK